MRPFYNFRRAVLCETLCDRFEIFRSISKWLELHAYQFLDCSNQQNYLLPYVRFCVRLRPFLRLTDELEFFLCAVWAFFTCDGSVNSNETESFQYSVTRNYFSFLEPSKIEMRFISVYFPYLTQYFLSQKEIQNCDSSSLSSLAILMHFPDARREQIPKIVVIETYMAEFRLIYGENGRIRTQ